ncbi:MAG: sulfite exporter TauE/SafE family protein, partial [Actinomycetota bacterium]|nr:sulfite exporter TauE/SafE family protein [Actinomycetota bacterium]
YKRDDRVDTRLTRIILLGTLPGVLVGAYIRIEYLPDPDSFKLLVGLLLLPLGIKLIFDAIRKRASEPADARPSTTPLFILSIFVGVGGGIYGIGGGAIIAPFLVGLLHLQTGRVVGATLIGTFVTSVVGVITFYVLDTQPDWALGALFGVGGLVGGYAGARFRKGLPEGAIKVLLGVLAAGLGLSYLVG